MRPRQQEQPRHRLLGCAGDVRRRPAELLQRRDGLIGRLGKGGLDLPVFRQSCHGTHDLDPAAVHPGLDPVDLIEAVVAVLLIPQAPGDRIEVDPKAVAEFVGEDLLEVRAGLAADACPDDEERVVGGRGAVGVETEDHPAEVSVIGLRTAELVVRDRGGQACFAG